LTLFKSAKKQGGGDEILGGLLQTILWTK
jgi:hypothetical protein